METCFHKIDECQDTNKHKETCIAESQHCFQTSNYGFDYCFKQLAHCVHEAEDDSKYEHTEEDAEHNHEECGCSCLISQCFDYENKEACSYMFDICFESDVVDDEHAHNHEEVGDGNDVHCLDYVRDCINEKDDHNECIDIMSQCFHPHSCSESVQQCISDNKYDIVKCFDIINDCSTSQEEATDVKDCYGHIEKCYVSSPEEDQEVCTALLPTCYSTTEDCYSKARSCLVNNYVENSDCHQQLKVCLHEEEDSYEDGYADDCTPVVQDCLSNSNLSPTSCYHYLQQYITGGQCHHENQNSYPQKENPQYTYQNYPEDPYQYNNNQFQYHQQQNPHYHEQQHQGSSETNHQFRYQQQQQNLHNHQHRQNQEQTKANDYWSNFMNNINNGISFLA